MKGYDHDRRNRTFHEVHGLSEDEQDKRERISRQRARNREPGRFGKVNWDAYQHDQLYDMIMTAEPGAMYTRAGQWQSLAAGIDATTGQVGQVMARLLDVWRGEAAVTSAESNSRLLAWAGDASRTASTIARNMATYTEAVERAQKYMPEPAFATAERHFRDGYTVVGSGGPSTAVLLKQLLSDGMVSREAAVARKAEAVAVMETYESQSKDVHDSMPHFTDVTPTTTEVPVWTPTPDDGHRTPGTPSTPPELRSDAPGSHGAGSSPGGTGSSTTAAGFASPAGLPGGLDAGSTYGGGLGSLGSGGSDVIRNSPGYGVLTGADGMSGRGAAGGVGAGRAGGGAGGAFGGMPIGRAQDEEDGEHRSKYEVGVDFLDDLPPAYPPVFGA